MARSDRNGRGGQIMSWFNEPPLRLEEYRKAHAEGHHDGRCEQQETSYICHCAKRKRERSGLIKVPSEGLDFPPPTCPVCEKDLWIDDCWHCDNCHLMWSADGQSPQFTDDFGDHFFERELPQQFGRLMTDLMEGGDR